MRWESGSLDKSKMAPGWPALKVDLTFSLGPLNLCGDSCVLNLDSILFLKDLRLPCDKAFILCCFLPQWMDSGAGSLE